MAPVSQELQLRRAAVPMDCIHRAVRFSISTSTPVKGVKGGGMLGHVPAPTLLGLSPRGRGNPRKRYSPEKVLRSIPASAEEPTSVTP